MERATYQTQILSLINILPKRKVKQGYVLSALQALGQATAKEIAVYLFQHELASSSERNEASPRLTELVRSGMVEILDEKAKCKWFGTTVSVYKIKERKQ
jgi:hypothetical protein